MIKGQEVNIAKILRIGTKTYNKLPLINSLILINPNKITINK